MMRSPLTGKAYSNIYKSFCEQQLNFQIVHGLERLADQRLLLVLDSSFNPPHSAHQNLIERAAKYYKNSSLHVLLLLSVNNADKQPKPATFDKRMEMMCLMADTLRNENISTSVGITTSAKFVDKDQKIKEYFAPHSLVCYLVGFDTIIRILDPKYYFPQSVAEALKEFMASTNFFCLTRNSGANVEKQMKYCLDISEGSYEPTIPREWGKKIQLELNDEKYASTSSSNIRESILNGSPLKDLQDKLPSLILTYLMDQDKNPFV